MKTGYEIINQDGPAVEGYWLCTVDIGYALIRGEYRHIYIS